MARKSLMVFIAGLVVCGLMFTVSCATKEIKPETGEQGTTDMTSSGGDQAAAPDQTMEDEAIQAEMQRARESFVSEDIHFDLINPF